MTIVTMTPAEHRARAEMILAQLAGSRHAPGTDTYRGLALAATAHVLAAVAAYLEPPPEPQIPGLPPGWKLETHQDPAGEQKWSYGLTAPGSGGVIATRHLWGSQEMAVAAGISEARKRELNRQET